MNTASNEIIHSLPFFILFFLVFLNENNSKFFKCPMSRSGSIKPKRKKKKNSKITNLKKTSFIYAHYENFGLQNVGLQNSGFKILIFKNQEFHNSGFHNSVSKFLYSKINKIRINTATNKIIHSLLIFILFFLVFIPISIVLNENNSRFFLNALCPGRDQGNKEEEEEEEF